MKSPLLWILFVAFGMIFYSEACSTEVEMRYHAYGKRDPFVSLVASGTRTGGNILSVENLDEIILQGVVYDPKQGSMAMANGVFLKEGEESGNVKLIKVSPESAEFLVNGMQGVKQLYPKENLDKETN